MGKSRASRVRDYAERYRQIIARYGRGVSEGEKDSPLDTPRELGVGIPPLSPDEPITPLPGDRSVCGRIIHLVDIVAEQNRLREEEEER